MAVSPAVGMAQGTALRPRLGAAGRHVPPRPFLLVPGFPCRRIRNPQKRLQMRKLLFLLPLVLAGLIIAADPIPSQPLVFEAGGGGCVDYGGGLGCFSPCQSSCEEVPTVTPTVRPTPTYVRESPTVMPCNRGLGNGSEGCDPGNSGGRPGVAGEGNE